MDAVMDSGTGDLFAWQSCPGVYVILSFVGDGVRYYVGFHVAVM